MHITEYYYMYNIMWLNRAKMWTRAYIFFLYCYTCVYTHTHIYEYPRKTINIHCSLFLVSILISAHGDYRRWGVSMRGHSWDTQNVTYINQVAISSSWEKRDVPNYRTTYILHAYMEILDNPFNYLRLGVGMKITEIL